MSSLLARRLQADSYDDMPNNPIHSPAPKEENVYETDSMEEEEYGDWEDNPSFQDEDYQEDDFQDEDWEDSLSEEDSFSEEENSNFTDVPQSANDDWFQSSAQATNQVKRKENWFESFMMHKQDEPDNSMEEELIENLEDNFGISQEELEEARYKYQKEQEVKRYTLIARLCNIALILGCGYLIFLIFGVAVTQFHYGQSGRIEPEILGIKDIREKKEFEMIQVEYEKCQMIYEKMLIVNYRLENAKENPKKIVTEYQPVLSQIDNFKKKNNAVVMPNKYASLKETMQTFYNASAIYCQKISSAYTNESETDYNDALISWYGDESNTKGVVNYFIILHQNVVALGDGIKGVDMVKIEQWNPDTYVQNYINGKEK